MTDVQILSHRLQVESKALPDPHRQAQYQRASDQNQQPVGPQRRCAGHELPQVIRERLLRSIGRPESSIAFISGSSAFLTGILDEIVGVCDLAGLLFGHVPHAFRQATTRQFVRMIFAHQLAVGAFDFGIAGG